MSLLCVRVVIPVYVERARVCVRAFVRVRACVCVCVCNLMVHAGGGSARDAAAERPGKHLPIMRRFDLHRLQKVSSAAEG
jgi:hypothetical protein